MMLSFHEEEEGLPESFLSNFPSLIKVDIHAKVTDPSVAKSMMGCLLSSLKAGTPHFHHVHIKHSSCSELSQVFVYSHPVARVKSIPVPGSTRCCSLTPS